MRSNVYPNVSQLCLGRRSVGRSKGRSVGRSVSQSVSQSVGGSVGQLVSRSGRSVTQTARLGDHVQRWSVGCGLSEGSISVNMQFIGASAYRLLKGQYVRPCVRASVSRFGGTTVCRYVVCCWTDRQPV